MAPVLKSPLRLGESLIQGSHITTEQLEEALSIQKISGARLGEILISLGHIHYLTLYQTIAELLDIPFINLREQPCDAELLETDIAQSFIDLRVLPWRKEQGKLLVAITEPESALQAKIESTFGDKVGFLLATPQDIHEQIALYANEQLNHDSVEKLWRNTPERSAKRLFLLRRKSSLLMPFIGALIFISILFEPTTLILLALINLVYLAAMLFKFQIFWGGYFYADKPNLELTIPDAQLPIYTLFIPLFREPKKTIENLIHSLRGLHYPKNKLDIKLIVEASDAQTIAHIIAQKPERIFHIVRVPYSQPQTKPKACNYALQFAAGELATIYDAEDSPDPLQLKKAAQMFSNIGEKLGCVQARLNYYNRRDNLLTRLFSLEYAMWFDAMLHGLERLSMPMPLGGTSNHFRTRILKSIHAWDPFNVTEDADLGLRLAEAGYQTRILDSVTLEEAPNSFTNWIKQRTRWVKGYIQTFFVHIRHPKRSIKNMGLKGVIGFVLFIGSASFAFIVTPFILLVTALVYVGYYDLPTWLTYLLLFNMTGGLLIHFIIAIAILWKHKWWDTLIAVPVFPFYWLLHTVASFRAVFQLIKGQTHLWEKTVHGLFKHKS